MIIQIKNDVPRGTVEKHSKEMGASSSSRNILKCKDFLVSGEYFLLEPCSRYEMLRTAPQPSFEELPGYYNSKDYISHSDSKTGLMNSIYQAVKSYMLGRKLKWIEEIKSGGRLLDIGAGTGDFLYEAKKRNWKVYGTEPSASARELAAKKGVVLEEEETFGSEEFDVVTMWHVLEHVSDLEKQIEDLYRLLKPGGLLVVAVPNHKSYDAQKYNEFWAAYDVPRHLWHFSRSSIKDLFENYDFSLDKEHPLKFDAYYVSLLSEKYKTGKVKPFSAFLSGFKSNWKARTHGEYSSIAFFLKKR